MKVDRQKFIDLLAEKTDMKPADAKAQLEMLTEKIMESAKKGKALEIKGFGLFYYSADGELAFNPSEDLETEVNYKYAGMEPLEIRKAREGAGLPVQEESPDEGIGKGAEDVEMVFGTERSAEPEKELNPSPKTEPGDPKPPVAKKTKGNPVATLVTSVVAILVIVVAIIVVLDFGLLDRMMAGNADEAYVPSPQARVESESAPAGAASPGVPADEITQPDNDLAGMESQAPPEFSGVEHPASAAIEEDEESESPTFGLHGAAGTFEGRHYSIVLHSVRTENQVDELKEGLENEGYRVIITPVVNANLGTMLRVGIGQFESIADAQEAAAGLSERYRENHFIGLIQ